jgi:hypothetical protein
MTEHRKNSLTQAVDILNANLIFVTGAAILEIGMYFYGHWMLILPAFIGKIIFYSAVYGMLAEIASGESIVSDPVRLSVNVKYYRKTTVFIIMLPLITHFLLFVLFSTATFSLILINWVGMVFFSTFSAFIFTHQKYGKNMQKADRKAQMGFSDAAFLAGSLTLSLGGFFLYKNVETFAPQFAGVVYFLHAYIALLVYVYIVCRVLDAHPEIRQQYTFEREIYLVNPRDGGRIIFHWASVLFIRTSQPGWITVIRSLTPESYHIRVFTRVAWHRRYYAPGKLVGITCSMSNMSPAAYKLAKEFKRQGSTVVMGGLHIQAFPDEALEYCDSVVIGEAEGVWGQVLKDYENNCLQQKYYSHMDENIYKDVHAYQMNLSPSIIRENILTNKGCKYQCYFCAAKNLNTLPYVKPAGEVVELVQRMAEGHDKFTFLDNNLYTTPEYLKDLFQRLKPLKIKWLAASTLEIAEDDELLTLAKESGCKLLYLGYELVPNANDSSQNEGKLSKVPEYLTISRKIHKKGISIRAHYIMGFDIQGVRAFWDLFVFNFRLRPLFNGIFILTPLPGSPFFRDVLPQNRITTLNWRNYDTGTLVFKPKKIPDFMLKKPLFSLYIIILFIFTTRFGWVMGLLLILFGFF